MTRTIPPMGAKSGLRDAVVGRGSLPSGYPAGIPQNSADLIGIMGWGTTPTAAWVMSSSSSPFPDLAGSADLEVWGNDQSTRAQNSAALGDELCVQTVENWWDGGYDCPNVSDLEGNASDNLFVLGIWEKITATPPATTRNIMGSNVYGMYMSVNNLFWQSNPGNAQLVGLSASANLPVIAIGELNRDENVFKLHTNEGTSAGQAVTSTLGSHTTAFSIGDGGISGYNGSLYRMASAAVWVTGDNLDCAAALTALSDHLGY